MCPWVDFQNLLRPALGGDVVLTWTERSPERNQWMHLLSLPRWSDNRKNFWREG